MFVETFNVPTVVEVEDERITVEFGSSGTLYTENGITGGGPMNQNVTIGLEQWILDQLAVAVMEVKGTLNEINVDSSDPVKPVVSLHPNVIAALLLATGSLQPSDIGVLLQPYSDVLVKYSEGDMPSDFTLSIVDSIDAAAWRAAIGAGTSSVVSGDIQRMIGLVPVEGILDTFMRSDAAQALDQNIAPVWTGKHTFTNTIILSNSPGAAGEVITSTGNVTPPVWAPVASGADPGALVGLTPVVGVALSWMRSDGAPALDQGISPVWTGDHNFTGGVMFGGEQGNAGEVLTSTGSGVVWAPAAITVVGGNPIAKVGLIAVDGVSLEFMRSDAAPALDMSIDPVWTGNHDFTGQVRFDGSAGSAGYVLTSTGGATPVWAPAPVSTVGANPSALVGLLAINGVADTYMRSDAAPALNQGINPTWTGHHTFDSSSPATAFITLSAGDVTYAYLGNGAAVLSGGIAGDLAFVNVAGKVILAPGGNDRFHVTDLGAIGIGGTNYGTPGQVLKSAGPGTAVAWATPASSGYPSVLGYAGI